MQTQQDETPLPDCFNPNGDWVEYIGGPLNGHRLYGYEVVGKEDNYEPFYINGYPLRVKVYKGTPTYTVLRRLLLAYT